MKQLSKKDVTLIEKYCGTDYAERCKGILKRSQEKEVRIVNTGMVSSGKSSLFNTLTGNDVEEYFKTGAARTTKETDCFSCNNISYIDTPGIDVRDDDDNLAYQTVMEADIIMMIHNIRTGPFSCC